MFGKMRTLDEFWKRNFDLLAGNKEMLEIWRKFEEFWTDFVVVFRIFL